MSTSEQVEAVVGDVGPADEAPVRRGRGVAVSVFVVLLVVMVGAVGFMLAPRGTSSSTKIADAVLPFDPAGQVAPDFTAARLDGTGSLTLSAYRGKPVVLNFWASWCTTCKAEAAVVAAAAKAWRDKGVVFIGVDAADTAEGGQGYEKTFGIDFPSVQDLDSRIEKHYLVTGYPETFFIDRDGTVATKYVSALDRTTLDQLVRDNLMGQ